MTRKYFGTDGIRGKANSFPMTAEMALKIAMATAAATRHDSGQDRVLIGKDTRLSCYMLEQAMAAGFGAMGMEVIFCGPLPTPGVAMLTRSLRADLGVMISASHNPYEDNGIKLFGPDGFKLPDEKEQAIETLIDSDLSLRLPPPGLIGRASRLDDAAGRYVEFVKASFPRRSSLEGLRIVVDCANGAAYKVAPQILWELEAEVIAMGDEPDGRNINDRCGATAPQALQARVLAEKAHIGIALDGDADRLILVDEKGQVVDGDQILALLAATLRARGRLVGDAVVATVMSNLGLEQHLRGQGIDLIRTRVGDRHVVERMRQDGYNLGGEQSGHIVLSDFGTTGDGLLAALQVLAVIQEAGAPASEVLRRFERLPQLLRNVRADARVLERDDVKAALAEAEGKLQDGRLLVRPSGTEPLVRIMAEGHDPDAIAKIVGDLCALIERTATAA